MPKDTESRVDVAIRRIKAVIHQVIEKLSLDEYEEVLDELEADIEGMRYGIADDRKSLEAENNDASDA